VTRRPWLRHPARSSGRPPICPTRLPRFSSIDRARDALTPILAPVGLTPATCEQCGGAHLVPSTKDN
jgi:hypothetical protein